MLFGQINVNYRLSLKYVICSFSHTKTFEYVNFYILQGKYFIHKKVSEIYTKMQYIFTRNGN